MSNDVAKREDSDKYPGIIGSVDSVKIQVQAVLQLMESGMQENTHYGIIPGTDKPTLYQAGAEKICMLFNIASKVEKVERIDLPGGHREYEITVGLYSRKTGEFIGSGGGVCSSMESKYRYRYDYESTGEPVQASHWDEKKKGKKVRPTTKVDGKWFYADRVKAENPDIADVFNTVYKMAEKRAFVNAVKRSTGVSDIYTQDIEDFTDELPAKKETGKKEPEENLLNTILNTVSTAPGSDQLHKISERAKANFSNLSETEVITIKEAIENKAYTLFSEDINTCSSKQTLVTLRDVIIPDQEYYLSEALVKELSNQVEAKLGELQ